MVACLLPLCVDAQEEEIIYPNGWSKPAKQKVIEEQKKIPPFVRGKDMPEPSWRRPHTENETTEEVKNTGSARYCTSYADFKAGNWKQVKGVEMKENSTSHRIWVGGNDFRFSSEDKTIDKIIKKEALFIVMDDSLYVNCSKMKANKSKPAKGYARGYRYDRDKVCFINDNYRNNSSQAAAAFGGVIGGAAGGLIVGAATASTNMKFRLCYIIDDSGKNATSLTNHDIENMIMVHPQRKDLWDWYHVIPKQERNRAENVLVVLEELDMLRPY